MIFGGAGDDDLFGGAGNDMLYGDAGDDRIFGDAGDDLIDAGAGNDTVMAETATTCSSPTAGDGNDTYYGDEIYGGTRHRHARPGGDHRQPDGRSRHRLHGTRQRLEQPDRHRYAVGYRECRRPAPADDRSLPAMRST